MFPIEYLEFIGVVVLAAVIAASNAGGIGGGGIIVPICLSFFQFDTKSSVALSNFLIGTGALTRFILNYRLKHPEKDAVVVDYDIVMVMLPMVLLGSLIGVSIN